MMISGNHDSAARVNVFRNVLARHDLYMIGQPPRREEDRIEQVVLKDAHGDVTFYLLPFVKPSMVKQIVGTAENGNNLSYNETLHRLIARESIDTSGRNVLVSHQFYLPVGRSADEVERMDSEIRTVGNIDEVKADMLEVFDYAALGHIHKPMSVGSSLFRYCGTPLACSVSEAGQEKGIIMVEMGEKGHVETSVLPLKPLHQVRIIEGELKDVLLKPSEDYVTVVLTDKAEIDSVDAIDRLRHAFPNILEIRREKNKAAELADVYRPEKEQSPFELCKAFLGEAQEEDLAIITDIINTISL